MASILPLNFPISQEQNAINYDFTSLATKTGLIDLYLMDGEDSTGVANFLTDRQLYSKNIYKTIDAGSAAHSLTKKSDLDYDLAQFNYTTHIEGNARIQIPFAFYGTAGGATTSYGYIIVRIKKNDSTLASVQSETLGNGASIYEEEGIFVMGVDIPRTKFSAGDYLRVTIEGWTYAGNTQCVYFYYGIDPMNRDQAVPDGGTGDFITTTSIISIPFKVDL